ncbi:endonuclease/exonuclease/phosphatase family protein [Aquimarina sp. U1-2]|uniref:endonuclease/exonuclease/phosphatase family protein n=1 Tax=Aquimarina sp. U1-2 TaxID=2823141 RepID=UPI001AECAF5E|nr:endonuclease/exonuclease/phosphatase family protein [Aquimarina sp. U1-2]MBP2831117.1 endonuclease/exonuclease/phosphatase family protein [Aquimarina sp. U1-2]
MIKALIQVLLLISISMFSQDKKAYTIQTIAFYNLENLFDTVDDPFTFDDDKTPHGKDHWTNEAYHQKLANIARVISGIGTDTAVNAPAIVGVCEIENRQVLEDLINQKALRDKNYGIFHFDSPDRRGIDVALLYKKTIFKPKHSVAYELKIFDQDHQDKRIYTRDQLVVSGYLDGELLHFIVNHWPSRRGGEARSRYKREKAAQLNTKIMDSLFALDPYAKIITMGDFNDAPNDRSIRQVLQAKSKKEEVVLKGLYNPMYAMAKKGMGTHAWRDTWAIFDQIILSKSLIATDYTTYTYFKTGIYNKDFLTTPNGKYKGYPFRSYSNGRYTGGYSDHYPVYVYLIKQKK